MTKSKRRNSFCVPSLPPLGSNNASSNANNADRPPLPPGHFLRNINLDGNLLDIPDPPSPPRRNPRRQSSPMLMPLRDVTNGESDNDDEHASSSVTTTGKRSRKSMCHVPSPATEMEESNESMDDDKTTTECDTFGNEKEAKTPSICFDDDENVAVSSSKRQKRRESMILPSDMAPLPMEEETRNDSLMAENDTDMNIDIADKEEKKQDAASLELEDDDDAEEEEDVESNKRASRRLSIVLPCNIASFQEEVANQVLPDEDSPMKEQEDNDADTLPIKRRQSMLLPSDSSLLPHDEQEGAKEYFGQLQNQQAQKKDASPPHQDSTADDSTSKTASTNEPSATDAAFSKDLVQGQVSLVAHQGDGGSGVPTATSEANHLRNLVRQYTSLPMSERNMSKQAEDIERLTGYALIPPAAKQQQLKDKSGIDLNWSGSPHHSNANENAGAEQVVMTSHNDSAKAKRELLLKLGAMVDLMDNRKAEDAKLMETSTGCRFHRSRSGKYRYYHISTNRKTSLAQYEQLYLAAVQQSKMEMSKRIQNWLRQSENCSDMSEEEIHEECVQLSALVESAQQPIAQHDETGMEASPLLNESDDQPPLDRSTSESDMEESPCDSSELESKDNLPPRVVVDQGAKPDNAQARNEVDMSLPDTTVSPASESSNESSSSTEEEDESLLPLPSRDEASDDPAIAAAEQRLWSDIDAALERYSRQVIAIRQARAASEQTNN